MLIESEYGTGRIFWSDLLDMPQDVIPMPSMAEHKPYMPWQDRDAIAWVHAHQQTDSSRTLH